MRPQQNRRIRGRSNNNNGNNNNNNRRSPNPLTRNYESNGPDVKIRGNAQHIADKYAALARDVQAAGDRVMAENYLQHAEHYMRIILSAQPQFVQTRQIDPVYEDGETSNIVDLPLADANEPQEADDGQVNTLTNDTQEAALHLIVNKEAVNTSKQADSKRNMAASDEESKDDAAYGSAAQPKIERPRRITRRRLPRAETANEAENAQTFVLKSPDKEEGEVHLASVHQATGQQAAHKEQDATPHQPKQDDVEKPRRRRRSVKNASEAVVAE